MCGITGIVAISEKEKNFSGLDASLATMHRRGPDYSATFVNDRVAFGHARLSIIDTSEAAHQPFKDSSGRYTIIFNGEIFNYLALKKIVEDHGIILQTSSDTEVLLYMYIIMGKDCQNLLNGFWAFAIYDNISNDVFLSRDRYGIKPLYYCVHGQQLYFASEMKAIMEFPIPRIIDKEALHLYFRLNYIPGPLSILQNVKKLMPGHYMTIQSEEVTLHTYYDFPYNPDNPNPNTEDYLSQQKHLLHLMDDAVRLRLIADVPLGAFLSGGIDSSAVVALASRHVSKLNTFSIGFQDAAFFDETHYAQLVAKKYSTNHTVFKLSNKDLNESLHEVLEYIDEPFADSSALLVNILSRHTRKHVTVALSGDAGDELFAGYNKHYAEWLVRNPSLRNTVVNSLYPIWKILPKSRDGKIANKVRQLERFAEGSKMSAAERYFRWCCIMDENSVHDLLKVEEDRTKLKDLINYYTHHISENGSMNDVLMADVKLVLPYDMLTKVDLMSMRNSLEVRVPFLDYRVVAYAFSLSEKSKINGTMKKMIVQDAFRELLPPELYNRPKSGFEVPLLQWFRTDLRSAIEDKYLNEKYIVEQQIFDPATINLIREKLFSNNVGDAQRITWSLVVFQHWYKKYMN
jgi:asparagine synthase (glutamine-hydrolysing)